MSVPVSLVCDSVPTVSLLRVDRELHDAVPEAERALAQRFLVTPRHDLPAGSWSPASFAIDHRASAAVLLIEGIVIRDVVVAGRASAHLFGPGDVLWPWREIDTVLAITSRWTCSTGGAAIAVLDERFDTAARKWPALSAVIQERLATQLDSLALRTAITALPRADQRILALLWQLADRWGVVTPDGVVVRLALTHELIGRLVGAKRPTVSLALHVLAADGALRRDPRGAWCLARDSYRQLDWGMAAAAAHRSPAVASAG